MSSSTDRRVALVSSSTRPSVESFESKRARQVTAQASKRLTEAEAEDLRYLWHGYESDLGIRSVHGAIERHLILKAPPRDLRQDVLAELQRAHGRMPEGRVLRIIVAEGIGTKREIRLAIERLCHEGKRGPKVERLPVDRPETPTTCEVKRTGKSCLHPCVSCEWTGYDLKSRERGELTMSLALASVPRDRWVARDEELEREWRMLAVKGEPASVPTMRDEPLSKHQRAAVNRAMATLATLTRQQVTVLELVFGSFHAVDDLELSAISSKFHVTKSKAVSLRDDACEAYRKARRAT